MHLNGHPTRRLPNTLNVGIEGTTGREILAATLDVAASTGSACHEGVDQPSAVLTAMDLPPDRARSALRLALGRWTTEADIEKAASLIVSSAAGAVRP